MARADTEPYLSVVATSRNDDHGGNLLGRMQIFVDGLIEQCHRHDIDCELILVEWNPPPDRPRLAEALRWPANSGPCQVRIIEVPPSLHARYRHAEALPLFQMIAKNVGVRRARGRFVLATNIDMLFSDALMARLSRQDLAEDRLYRVDRYDVRENVPIGAPVCDALAFCEDNVIRICKRKGTVDLRAGRTDYIYRPRTLMLFRALFLTVFAPVTFFVDLFRYLWMFIILYLNSVSRYAALLRGDKLFPYVLSWKNVFHPPSRQDLRGKLAIMPRLFFFVCARKIAEWYLSYYRSLRSLHRFLGLQRRRRKLGAALWRTLAAIAQRGIRSRVTSLPALWRDLAFEVRRGRLHTNACGDFTLLARQRWFELRGYPEFEMYSFHLDSLLCHAAVCSGLRETVFRNPARIYHVEHSDGSGFTPEGQHKLWSWLKRSGIRRLSDDEFYDIVIAMRQKQRSLLFNGEAWGLAGHELPEIHPLAVGAGRTVVAR